MNRKIAAIVLIFSLISGNLTMAQARTTKSQTLEYDQTVLAENCIEAGIDGDYISEAQEALVRINEIRKEACEEGVPNPDMPGTKLTPDDYVPIQWSSDLEYMARIRAAEASIVTDHVRTSGQSCFDVNSPNNVFSNGEVLAWSFSNKMVYGVNQWYGEKEDWVKQNAGAVTGHYTSMIAPGNTYVGLGTFYTSNGVWPNTTCGRFSPSGSLDSSYMPEAKNVVQKLQIHRYLLTQAFIQEEEKISGASAEHTVGDQYLYALRIGTNYEGDKGSVLVLDTVSWSSSDPSVASVDKDGVVSLKSAGTVTLTAAGSEYTATKTLTVKKKQAEKNSTKVTTTNGKKSPTVDKTKITSLKAGKKKLSIKWKKVSKNASGYQVQYALNEKFTKQKKTKTVKGYKTSKLTVSRLKTKKKYYVRIRIYYVYQGKKYYSKWSSVKSKKVK